MESSPSHQIFVPCLCYKDAPAALEFLSKAFGFEESARYVMPDGRVGHSEMRFGNAVVMVVSVYWELGFASPGSLNGAASQVLCYLDDVDAHFERARDAGATIAAEPCDEHGSRSYRALDLEGHRWIFSTPPKGGAA